MNGHTIDAAARIEDLTFLADHGVGLEEAARRTGLSHRDHLDTWLRRRDQHDLRRRLVDNDARHRGAA